MNTGSTAGSTARDSDLISVIVPCFNGEAYLQSAIESVLGQTYPHVELIVVDDASTDSSRDIARRYGDRLTLIEQDHRGLAATRNHGIKVSHGRFIAFLDCDDYWAPAFLEELHKALINSDAVLAYCGWQNVGLEGPRGRPYIPPDYEAGNKVESFLRAGSPWPVHATLLHRSPSCSEIKKFRHPYPILTQHIVQ